MAGVEAENENGNGGADDFEFVCIMVDPIYIGCPKKEFFFLPNALNQCFESLLATNLSWGSFVRRAFLKRFYLFYYPPVMSYFFTGTV